MKISVVDKAIYPFGEKKRLRHGLTCHASQFWKERKNNHIKYTTFS